MLIYAAFIDKNGEQQSNIYHGWSGLWDDTIDPATRVQSIVKFKIIGKTYAERRESVEDIAKRWQSEQQPGLSWGELAEAQSWLEKQARRYGLVRIFESEGII